MPLRLASVIPEEPDPLVAESGGVRVTRDQPLQYLFAAIRHVRSVRLEGPGVRLVKLEQMQANSEWSPRS